MSSSVEAMLALVEADVPVSLISVSTFAMLKSICRLLPMEITSLIGFESRLEEKSAEVDLDIRVPVPRGLEVLAGNDMSCRLPDYFFEEVSWQRLRSFALAWQAWPKELREAVPAAWLGFDADQLTSPVPSPGLLYLPLRRSDASRKYCHQISRAAYGIIKDRPLQPERAAALDSCLDRLPDHALVFLAGMGISRPTDAVRLALANLPPRDMLNYLSATGWTGSVRELELLLHDMGRFTDQLTLGIDILTSVCPKIGIECYIGREEDSVLDRRWLDFFDFMKGKGWCLPEKSDGLLQWPGRNLFQAGKGSWPWTVERFLNHAKINYDPVSGVEAKAYFGIVWRSSKVSLAT